MFERHFELPTGLNVLASCAETTFTRRLRVLYADGSPVGAILVRGFRTVAQGQRMLIFRAAACVDAAFRRSAATLGFLARVVLSHRLKHPRVAIYYIDPVIHPSSYLTIHKNIARVYPNPRGRMPPKLRALLDELKLGVLSSYEFAFDHPFVCRVPFNTVESAEDARRWRQRAETDPHVKVFMDAGAAERDRGLLCIVPIDALNVLLSLPRIAFKVASRACRRVYSSAAAVREVDGKSDPSSRARSLHEPVRGRSIRCAFYAGDARGP